MVIWCLRGLYNVSNSVQLASSRTGIQTQPLDPSAPKLPCPMGRCLIWVAAYIIGLSPDLWKYSNNHSISCQRFGSIWVVQSRISWQEHHRNVGWIILCGVGGPMLYRVLSSISGLYTLGSSQLWQPKMSPDIVKCLHGDNIAPGWNKGTWVMKKSKQNTRTKFPFALSQYSFAYMGLMSCWRLAPQNLIQLKSFLEWLESRELLYEIIVPSGEFEVNWWAKFRDHVWSICVFKH